MQNLSKMKTISTIKANGSLIKKFLYSRLKNLSSFIKIMKKIRFFFFFFFFLMIILQQKIMEYH